jgi:hypothetical protein
MVLVSLEHSESDESNPTCPNSGPKGQQAIISANSQTSLSMNDVKEEN